MHIYMFQPHSLFPESRVLKCCFHSIRPRLSQGSGIWGFRGLCNLYRVQVAGVLIDFVGVFVITFASYNWYLSGLEGLGLGFWVWGL